MKLQAAELHVRRSGQEVLAGLSFSVAAGEVYGLLGGNGAGKSTTLATFLGFLTPSSGRVRVVGRDVAADVAAARKAIAYVPETAALYGHLNARENLQYFLRLAGVQRSEAAIETALDHVLLAAEARERRLHRCSKGMRQKVAIALALLRDTDTLLLDEPTSGLDPMAIDEFHQLLRGLARPS
jgi:ABC-2 type transport system ATP-binding protein